MSKLEFKKYAGSEELAVIGTVAEQIGKKGTVKFSNKNFNDDTKRVVVIATNENNESVVVTCSSALSKALRKAKADGGSRDELLAQAIMLPIYETETGFFIGMEGGEANVGKSVAELTKVKISNKIESLDEVPW